MRRGRANVAEQALDNKRFQTRAVSYVAAQGVRQFLDIGSGLPTSPVRTPGAEPLWVATHEAARAAIPGAMVAYVDYDPMAVLHSQALLGGGYREVVAVGGDMPTRMPSSPTTRYEPPGSTRTCPPACCWPACCTSSTPRPRRAS